MASSFLRSQPVIWYILHLLYCFVPALVMYFGLKYVSEIEWIWFLVIHLIIMILIPTILMMLD